MDRSEAEDRVRAIMGRCRRRRVELGWTQSQLAQRSGIDRTTISEYDGNVTWPTLVNLVRLTDALDLNLDGLPRQTPLD